MEDAGGGGRALELMCVASDVSCILLFARPFDCVSVVSLQHSSKVGLCRGVGLRDLLHYNQLKSLGTFSGCPYKATTRRLLPWGADDEHVHEVVVENLFTALVDPFAHRCAELAHHL